MKYYSPKPPSKPNPKPCRSYRQHKFTRLENRNRKNDAVSWVTLKLRDYPKSDDICRNCGWTRAELEKIQRRENNDGNLHEHHN